MTALASLLALTATLAASSPEEPVVFALHLGVNVAPEGSGLEPLHYADDDAARFYELTRSFAEQSILVATLDRESQLRHPDLAGLAVPPTPGRLEGAVSALRARMARARADGRRVVLLFSYSGHGIVEGDRTSLTLLGGALDRAFLEEKIATLPADAVHLVLDACHAGGLVQQRGFTEKAAEGRRLQGAEADVALGLGFFQRFPHVGALIATSPDGVTHEWSALESGVFTYELVSALRGAADINGDGRVAYSEVGAFVSAANRAIADPRGRVELLVEPPRQNQREPLVDVGWAKAGGFLEGRGEDGRIRVERGDGLRLVDLHPGGRAPYRVLLPAGARLFVERVDAEYDDERQAAVTLRRGERVAVRSLAYGAPTRVASRGGLESALREGFFKKPYDRSYYEGYVDSSGLLAERFEQAPDGLSGDDDDEGEPDEERRRDDRRRDDRRYQRDDDGELDDYRSRRRAQHNAREDNDEPLEEGRHPLVYLAMAGLGGVAVLAGAVTLTVGGLSAFSAVAFAATPYPAEAMQRLGDALIFGALTVGGAVSVAALLGGTAAIFLVSAPDE